MRRHLLLPEEVAKWPGTSLAWQVPTTIPYLGTVEISFLDYSVLNGTDDLGAHLSAASPGVG